MHQIEKQPEQRPKTVLVGPKDLDVSYFCGSGAGGQARNKVASGCQIIHRESGAIGRASDSRSQADNKATAFIRLTKDPRMKFFIARKIHEMDIGMTVEQEVEKMTKPEHLKYEIKNAAGQWEEVPASYFDGPAAKGE